MSDGERESDDHPKSVEPSDRVKGDRHEGPIPTKELLRIVVIGVPVMIAAWYFLLWMKGGFR